MIRTPFIGALVLLQVALHTVPFGHLRAQVPGSAGHDHLTEVACVDVPSGQKRPGVWLLQHRRGHRIAFQSSIRLLASARVSKQEGCGGGEKCDGDCGGRRRASVALGIRSTRRCSTGR